MTDMGLDIEAIEALDFEFAPPCEALDGCDNTASWQLRLSCCGRLFLLCDPCIEYVKSQMERTVQLVFTCNSCGNKLTLRNLVATMEKL